MTSETTDLWLPSGARSRATDALGLLRRHIRPGSDFGGDVARDAVDDVLSKFDGDGAVEFEVDADDLDVLWFAASEMRFTFRDSKPEVLDADFERFEHELIEADRALGETIEVDHYD